MRRPRRGQPGSPEHVLGASKQFGADRNAAAIIGETRSPGSRTRQGRPGRSAGATRPGTRSACRTCHAATGSRRAGRCTARHRTPCRRFRGGGGATRDGRRPPRTSRDVADDPAAAGRRAGLPWAARWTRGCRGRPPAMRRIARTGIQSPRTAPQPRDAAPAERARGRCRKGKPQPPHWTATANGIVGFTQPKLRSDDLLKDVRRPIKTHQDHPPRPPSRRPRAETSAHPLIDRSPSKRRLPTPSAPAAWPRFATAQHAVVDAMARRGLSWLRQREGAPRRYRGADVGRSTMLFRSIRSTMRARPGRFRCAT